MYQEFLYIKNLGINSRASQKIGLFAKATFNTRVGNGPKITKK